ncbi:MAG TPA: hypothetical protein VIS27_08035 [Yeosuana sp.]
MKNNIKYTFLLTVLFAMAFVGCEEEGVLPIDIPTAISFHLDKDAVSVQPGGSQYAIQLQSTTKSNIDRTYNITLNESASTGLTTEYSLTGTSVTIPAGSLLGSVMVNFNYDAIPLGVTRKLVFDLNEITDGSYTNLTRTSMTLNYSAFCPYNEVVVTFSFDNYPEEAYWQLYDSADNLLAGDGYAGNDCYVELASTTALFCLTDGDYQWLMGDCYGDGGTAYTISSGGKVLYSSPGITGTGEVVTFSLP